MPSKEQSIEQTILVNGINVKGLFETIEAVQGNPKVGEFRLQLNNKWLGSTQTISSINEFQGACQTFTRGLSFVVHTDEPGVLLGTDTAPGPGEYMLSALAACVTTSIVYHAAARGIEIQAIESRIDGDIDLRGFLNVDKSVRKGFQNIRMNFRIKADGSEELIQELVNLGQNFSPVFDTLSKGVPITIKAERIDDKEITAVA